MTVLSFEKKDDLEEGRAREALEERLSDAGVRWLCRRYHRRPSLLATGWDVATGGAMAARAGGGGWALVHARSYVAGAVGVLLARRAPTKLLFDMRGFWVDERIEAGLWAPGSIPVRVTRTLERTLLGRADAVTVLTRSGSAALRAEYPIPASTPVHVIPTCVDMHSFRPSADPEELRKQLEIPGGPVVAYVGSLSTWYMAELTVAIGLAFARLGGGHFLILTREEALAHRLVPRAPGNDAVTIRSVPHAELPHWLAACDAGLAPVMAAPSKRASAPTKVGEYLAAGLAVAVTAGVGDLDEQLAGTDAGFTFDPSEAPDAIARRLLELSRRPGRAAAAREVAARHYSLEDGLTAYAEIYRSLGVQESAP